MTPAIMFKLGGRSLTENMGDYFSTQSFAQCTFHCNIDAIDAHCFDDRTDSRYQAEWPHFAQSAPNITHKNFCPFKARARWRCRTLATSFSGMTG